MKNPTLDTTGELVEIIDTNDSEYECDSLLITHLLVIEYHREDDRDKYRITKYLRYDTDRSSYRKCKKIRNRCNIDSDSVESSYPYIPFLNYIVKQENFLSVKNICENE
jgi:hypothetical protein